MRQQLLKVTDASGPEDSSFALILTYKSGSVGDTLMLRLRNREQVRLWVGTIERLCPVGAITASPVEERRRRRLSVSGLLNLPIPTAANAATPATTIPEESLEELPGTRVKIVIEGEIYIAVVAEVVSIGQLKSIVTEKAKPDWARLGRKWDYPESDMRLKYADEFKDLINIVTDDDIDIALDYCPNYIAVHVSRLSKATPMSPPTAAARPTTTITTAAKPVAATTTPRPLTTNAAVATKTAILNNKPTVAVAPAAAAKPNSSSKPSA